MVSQLDSASHVLCLVSYLMRYATETKNASGIDSNKQALLQVYVKTVLGGKIKPAAHAVVRKSIQGQHHAF